MNPQMAAQMRSRGHKLRPPVEGEPMPFSVVGVSCVTHPINPHCPTVHFNYRYFEVQTADGIEAWFGGGTDLTPSFINEEDIRHFHRSQKNACDIRKSFKVSEGIFLKFLIEIRNQKLEFSF